MTLYFVLEKKLEKDITLELIIEADVNDPSLLLADCVSTLERAVPQLSLAPELVSNLQSLFIVMLISIH